MGIKNQKYLLYYHYGKSPELNTSVTQNWRVPEESTELRTEKTIKNFASS